MGKRYTKTIRGISGSYFFDKNENILIDEKTGETIDLIKYLTKLGGNGEVIKVNIKNEDEVEDIETDEE